MLEVEGISKDREDRIVNFLREYIKLCKKHLMQVVGSIGADTSLWDEELLIDVGVFEIHLRGKVDEMVFGGMGGPGLFSDDGDQVPTVEQLDRIVDRVFGNKREV